MEKKVLLLVSLLGISTLMMGQKYDATLKKNPISQFKNRMSLSTSLDPLAVIDMDTSKREELTPKRSFVTRSSRTKRLKSTNEFKTLIDTAYIFPWISKSQQWDTVPSGKIIYNYDNNNNLIQYVSATWNTLTKSWVNTSQVVNKYNESNQLISVLQQNWKNRGRSGYGWVNNYQNITQYDSLGRKSSFLFQTWNTSKNNWLNSWQHQFDYDSIGNNINILEIDWSITDNSWVLGYKYVNQFDSVSHITSNLIQIWYDSTWTNSAQSIFSYDQNGNKTSMLNQAWNYDLGLFENSELDSIFYRSSKDIELWVIRLWDRLSSDWYILQQGVYGYDSIGNNISILYQDYDPYSNGWINNTEYLYEYDDQHTQFSSALLYGNSNTEEWNNGTKTEQHITYISDTKKISATNPNIDQYPLSPILKVYPIPAREFVNVEYNIAIDQIQVFDLSGSKVLANSYYGLNNIQLDIAKLKAGVYLLQIKISDGTMVAKRLIKQ